jgi:hypothetical protein
MENSFYFLLSFFFLEDVLHLVYQTGIKRGSTNWV